MQNTLRFGEWAQRWWERNLTKREDVDPQLREGLQSYAREHIQAEVDFNSTWLAKWDTVYDRACEFIAAGFGSTTVSQDSGVVEVEVPDIEEDE